MARSTRSNCLALALALYCGSLAANSPTLDAAVKKYYAGQAEQAIALLEPLAIGGDVDAQYLLGNMIYSLSQAGESTDDPARWYRLAAAQDSAPANYALGTLYQNRWLQSRRHEDADFAQTHFERAAALGEPKAAAALEKLAAHRRAVAESSTLTYTNESFGSTRTPAAKPQAAATKPAAAQTLHSSPDDALSQALANFRSSGDLAADALALQRLINEAYAADPSAGNAQAAETGGNIGALMQLLGGFESTEKLLNDLAGLYQHIKAASELSTAPGAK